MNDVLPFAHAQSPLSFSSPLFSCPVVDRRGGSLSRPLSSISDRVKQTLAGSRLYRDNGCNFGSFPVPTLLLPVSLSRSLSPYAISRTRTTEIAEADRGGFDCTALDRRFINPLSARLASSRLQRPRGGGAW